MHKSTWKRGESRVAALFHSKRKSLSGGGSKLTRSDSTHPKLFIECKHAKRHATWTLLDDAKPKAKAEGKSPVIALLRKGSPGAVLCVHTDDVANFVAAYLGVDGVTEL